MLGYIGQEGLKLNIMETLEEVPTCFAETVVLFVVLTLLKP